MSEEQPECLRCGRCCSERGQDEMYVSSNDVKRWIYEFRTDILEKLNFCTGILNDKRSCLDQVLENGDKKDSFGALKQCEECWGGDIVNTAWTSTKCVFLRKIRNEDMYRCSIEKTKPDHCREWQVGWHKNCPQRHLNPNPDPR